MWVFPKIGGKPPKWMVCFMENPIKMDDLGVPLFLETPMVFEFSSSTTHLGFSMTLKMNGCQFPHAPLVGGFNPFEKYARQNGNIPQIQGENKKCFKPPPCPGFVHHLCSMFDGINIFFRFLPVIITRKLPMMTPYLPSCVASRKKNLSACRIHYPGSYWLIVLNKFLILLIC